MCITMNLALGDVATQFYHLLESPGHGLHLVLEFGRVLHPDDPQLQDLLQLLKVGRGGALQPTTAQWLSCCQPQIKV